MLRCKAVAYDFHRFAVGMLGIFSTLEHTYVPAFEAERKDVENHIGSGLEYNAYHPIGDTHLAELESIGQGTPFQLPARGVFQTGDIGHIGSY